MILGTPVDQVEITVGHVGDEKSPCSANDDVLLSVAVRCGHYAGVWADWVVRDDWNAFLAALISLERDRRGAAVLESPIPGHLKVRVFATDQAGHLAVEGLVKQSGKQELCLQFSSIEFDPSQLRLLVDELQSSAPAA